MARDAFETDVGGELRDRYGRPEYVLVPKHTTPASSDVTRAYQPTDGDGRIHMVIQDQTGNDLANLAGLTIPVAPPSGDSTGVADLAAIQARINAAGVAGGGVVRLQAGKLYTISTPNSKTFGTPSGGSTSLTYGIDIPSNVTLDLNGATIKAASSGAAGTLIVNRNPVNGGGDVNVGLISSSSLGVIDGNNVVASPVGQRALVMIAWSTNPIASNFVAQNGYTVGFWVFGNTGGNYGTRGPIASNGIKGGGTSFGQPYVNAMEFNATIGTVLSMNTTAEPSNLFFNPGNGNYLVMTNSTAGTIISISNSGGDKLDRPSSDIQIGCVYGVNSGDSNGNSGFKFQGGTSTSAGASSSPQRCEIGLLHMVNQAGTGLYMENSIDCTVTKYIGEGNGTAGGLPDVWIGGVRDTVTELHSDNAFLNGLAIRAYAVDPTFGPIKIRNPNQSNTGSIGAISQAGAYAVAGRVLCVDELPVPINVVATAQAGGGTFAGGVLQCYRITYINANGETTPGAEAFATPAASGTVLLTWGTGALPTGVTGVKVYRSLVANGEYTSPALVATLGAVLTYTDTGTAVGAGAAPTLNTATTLKMKSGVSVTNPAASFHAESIKIVGAATISVGGNISQAMGAGTQRLVSGQYIRPKTGNVTTVQPAQGVLSAMPIDIGNSGSVATIGVNVTTAGQAGALVRLGIYGDNGFGQPGSLLIDAGTVTGDAIHQAEVTVGLWLPAGRYFLASVSQACATTAPILSGSSAAVDPPIPLNALSAAWFTNQNCFSQAAVTGALPASWGTPAQGAAGVIPAIKAT